METMGRRGDEERLGLNWGRTDPASTEAQTTNLQIQ
jgi:hypothetical protein